MIGNYHDSLNLLRKFTLLRVLNALQIFASYLYSRITKKPNISGLPISISIEPTTSCNLRCPECPSGLRQFTRPTGMLDKEMFDAVLNETANKLMYMLFYFQGEPYLHPQFLELVEKAVARKVYTATSTNAHYLNDDNARKTVESGLDRLIISIDGTTQETYESYRVGGSLEKVIEGTKNILKWKKQLKSRTPFVMFQFLVVRPNEHQISEVHKLGKSLGVDKVVLKTAQIYDYENGSSLIPTIQKYSRYRFNSSKAKYEIKNKLLNHCWKMWHSCVLTWDGKVVPCCFDKDASHVMGEITKNTFNDIWENGSYTSFRKGLIKARNQIDICTNCTEGVKVWA